MIRHLLTILVLMTTSVALTAAETIPLFDGKTLTGWDGDGMHWRVEDGSLIGETTTAAPLAHNTFLIWRGGTVTDCEITLSYRIMSEWANSGLQYRSKDLGNHLVAGYQANIESGGNNGMVYSEETGREILAKVGQRTWVGDGKTKKRSETLGEPAELLKAAKGRGEWNRYRLTARGNAMTIAINDTVIAETFDESAKDAVAEGLVALQLHTGKPMTIQFKDLVLRPLAP